MGVVVRRQVKEEGQNCGNMGRGSMRAEHTMPALFWPATQRDGCVSEAGLGGLLSGVVPAVSAVGWCVLLKWGVKWLRGAWNALERFGLDSDVN